MSLLQKEFRRLRFPQEVSLLYLVPEGVGALSIEIIHIGGTDLKSQISPVAWTCEWATRWVNPSPPPPTPRCDHANPNTSPSAEKMRSAVDLVGVFATGR